MKTIYSFGYKYRPHGVTPAMPIIDVRHLPNPYNHKELRDLTGKDFAVQHHVTDCRAAKDVMTQAETKLATEDFLAFACHGGRHRSVAMAELLATALRLDGHQVHVIHLEESKWSQ